MEPVVGKYTVSAIGTSEAARVGKWAVNAHPAEGDDSTVKINANQLKDAFKFVIENKTADGNNINEVKTKFNFEVNFGQENDLPDKVSMYITFEGDFGEYNLSKKSDTNASDNIYIVDNPPVEKWVFSPGSEGSINFNLNFSWDGEQSPTDSLKIEQIIVRVLFEQVSE